MIPLWAALVLVALVASLATAAVGFAFGHLVELRLKAMRELFGMAIVQRESFDAALRDRDTRIEQVQKHIENLDKAHREHRDDHAALDKRVKALEGKRLSPP